MTISMRSVGSRWSPTNGSSACAGAASPSTDMTSAAPRPSAGTARRVASTAFAIRRLNMARPPCYGTRGAAARLAPSALYLDGPGVVLLVAFGHLVGRVGDRLDGV